LSNDAARLAAERSFMDAWRLMAAHAPGGAIDDADDLLFTALPIPMSFFNSAFVKPPTDARTCIDRAIAFFGERALPFSLRCREDDRASDVASACKAAGLDAGGSSPLMVAAISDVETRVEGDIRAVDASTWDAHVETIATGFGMATDVVRTLLSPTLLDSGLYTGFIAYADGQPASTSALIVSDEIAGVYNVATPEPFRGRGLGAATTRAAIAEGERRGCVLTTLQASDMGYPIYERMGYRTVTRWSTYTG
jgi:GNAT superfamily N-acetyltransferase